MPKIQKKTKSSNVLKFSFTETLNLFLKAQENKLPFSHKSMIFSITHEQNIIGSKTLICRQLFAGHVVGSLPMKRKEKIHRMIINNSNNNNNSSNNNNNNNNSSNDNNYYCIPLVQGSTLINGLFHCSCGTLH